jgi:hypothetical protein
MRLYVIYAPVHHAAGNIHRTAADAEQDETAGADNPPTWTEQPAVAAADQHANDG